MNELYSLKDLEDKISRWGESSGRGDKSLNTKSSNLFKGSKFSTEVVTSEIDFSNLMEPRSALN